MSIVDKLGISINLSNEVSVNSSKLSAMSDCLKDLKNTTKGFVWIDDKFWPSVDSSHELVSQFFTLGNSINFKYWTKDDSILQYCHGQKNGIDVRGAMYMWRCLKTCYDKNSFDIFDSTRLSKLTFNEFRQIFQDDDGNDVLPSLKQRYDNWMDLATKLNQNWDGKTINLITACKNSLIEFTNHHRKFVSFDDPLCKMIMVNAIMHQGRNIINFKEPIIPGIDYQILKQLLRQGIVTTNDTISKKLTNYQILNNSEAELLRKAALSALSQIMTMSGISGDYIDNMIWGNRTKCEDEHPVCKISKETECPFHKFCDKKTDLLIPLEETRYY